MDYFIRHDKPDTRRLDAELRAEADFYQQYLKVSEEYREKDMRITIGFLVVMFAIMVTLLILIVKFA